MVLRRFAMLIFATMALFAAVPVATEKIFSVARECAARAWSFVSEIFKTEPLRISDGNPRSIFETRRMGLC